MASTTIAAQIARFNTGFSEQIGEDLAGVFDGEQQLLRQQGIPHGAIAAGGQLPAARLISPDGSGIDLDRILDGRPAVLVFYRGAWCPYCNIALKTYQQELLPVLKRREISLIAISPQTPDGSEKAISAGALDFTVLSDPGNVLSRELGIVTEPSAAAREAQSQLGFDVADSNADASGQIPFPTVLVVDGSGRIVFADVHVDYTTRTEVQDIVDATAGLT